MKLNKKGQFRKQIKSIPNKDCHKFHKIQNDFDKLITKKTNKNGRRSS